VVVDGGGRRSREARDREVEERDGFVTLGWWESEVVVVEKASSHFWRRWRQRKRNRIEFGALFSVF
jgi:hypothetical protein